MEMDSEEILKLVLETLRRLETRLGQQEEAARLASSQGPRPTEQFPKIELEIRKAIEAHTDKCLSATKERMGDRLDPLVKKVEKIESRLDEMKKELGGKINGVKDEAAKTATGSVVSLTEKVDLLGRDVAGIKKTLVGQDNEPGLEDMVRELGGWVETEENARNVAREASRFNVTTWLTIIGILVAIGAGVAGIIW